MKIRKKHEICCANDWCEHAKLLKENWRLLEVNLKKGNLKREKFIKRKVEKKILTKIPHSLLSLFERFSNIFFEMFELKKKWYGIIYNP